MKKVKFAPLSGAYMASSMLGFFISILYVYKQAKPWGIAFALVFIAMFIASVGSMTNADPDAFVAIETKNKKKKS